ncbi:MAG: OB-fold nucleic acid binding domain-containing protein [Nocardioidaceae bacterium]|nr:OB-fold nucleic acid binding domain-containing protein [Nocardioidaceae bacterium]
MSTVAGDRIRRALKRFSASPAELEADELRQERQFEGCQTIEGVTDRQLVTLYGHLKNVSLAPRAGTPTLEAALYDGTGVVTLIWLGRRTITGITPGASLVAWGRVSCHDGRRIIYNPRYELRV